MDHRYYDEDTNTYIEEIGDLESGGFYQKKVIQQGPGFQSVTIVSRGGGGMNIGFGPMDVIGSILGDIFGEGGPQAIEDES